MNKLTTEELDQARARVLAYLTERKEILKALRMDKAHRLVEYAKAGLINCDADGATDEITIRLTDKQVQHLLDTASENYTAWEILRQCASENPDDQRLKPFIKRILSGEKAPKQKPGRRPNVMRDFFILYGVEQLLHAGLNPPSVSQNTRKMYNSAYMMADVLKEVGICLSPDVVRDIWADRDNILEKAKKAAMVLKT